MPTPLENNTSALQELKLKAEALPDSSKAQGKQLIVCDVSTDYKYMIMNSGKTAEITINTSDRDVIDVEVKTVDDKEVASTFSTEEASVIVVFIVPESGCIVKVKFVTLYYATGVVKYTNGNVIVGGTVKLTGTTEDGEEVSETTVTDEEGRFYFRNLKYGEYKVTYKGIAVDAELLPQE